MATILVPLDGSAFAETVLPYVRLLAKTLNADVQLLRVVTAKEQERFLAYESVAVWDDTLPSRADIVAQVSSDLHEEANSYLKEQAEALVSQGLTVATRLVDGQPAIAIIQLAEELQPVLIAMASHGYSGLERWSLGSVTDRVVSASTTPVLVVRSTEGLRPGVPKLQHILVPLDGSPLADQALPLALSLARRAQAQLILLRVVEPPFVGDPYTSAQYMHWMEVGYEEACRRIERSANELRQQHDLVSSTVQTGHPAELIVSTAMSNDADLIVMATHGYTGLRRWALGSVADKVLHASATPLLLVRSRNDDR